MFVELETQFRVFCYKHKGVVSGICAVQWHRLSEDRVRCFRIHICRHKIVARDMNRRSYDDANALPELQAVAKIMGLARAVVANILFRHIAVIKISRIHSSIL